MARLQEQLKYFAVKKVSTDPLWHGVRVYLSGHEVCRAQILSSSTLHLITYHQLFFITHLFGLKFSD